jgi:hypothetical protein
VRKDLLQCTRQLESVNTAKSELDMCVNDELCETQDFTAQVEHVSKTGLLALLRRQGIDQLYGKARLVNRLLMIV